MTPKEKAQELVDKFTSSLFDTGHRISKPMIKLCALIAVDEIYEDVKIAQTGIEEYWDYWQQVKSEIEKL